MAGISDLKKTMNINGKPHRLAWINGQEENLLKMLGGSGKKIKGFPAYFGDASAEQDYEDQATEAADEAAWGEEAYDDHQDISEPAPRPNAPLPPVVVEPPPGPTAMAEYFDKLGQRQTSEAQFQNPFQADYGLPSITRPESPLEGYFGQSRPRSRKYVYEDNIEGGSDDPVINSPEFRSLSPIYGQELAYRLLKQRSS